MKLKFLGNDKKKTYSGIDDMTKKSIFCHVDDIIEVSSVKGGQLVNDFGDMWKVIEGTSSPLVTSLEMKTFKKAKAKLDLREKELIKKESDLEKQENDLDTLVSQVDSDSKQNKLDKENLETDRKVLDKEIKQFDIDKEKFYSEKVEAKPLEKEINKLKKDIASLESRRDKIIKETKEIEAKKN